MSILKETKKKIIADFAINDGDTGSAEVQCAILSHRIQALTEHMKTCKKDFQSRRGLIAMVNRRKSLLKYLSSSYPERYSILIEKLGIRSNK